ncbi:MAG TPA: hypothetical protein VJ011_09785 [Steroidobacteraceae bacterium]|nr:hypothetical protein [Steroidobacteraceae bacterium]
MNSIGMANGEPLDLFAGEAAKVSLMRRRRRTSKRGSDRGIDKHRTPYAKRRRHGSVFDGLETILDSPERQRRAGFLLYVRAMRIAQPMLLVLTPIGVAGGLYEAYRLAGGLVVLMAAMVALVGVAIATVVVSISSASRRTSPVTYTCRK